MKLKIFALTTLLFLSATICFSQKSDALNWKFSVQEQGGKSVLVFETTIKDGFHLYSPYNPEGASKPLEIKISDTQNYAAVGAIKEAVKPTEKYEEIFDVTEKYFEKSAKFTVEITPKSFVKQAVTGHISGQVCNDQYMCSMFDEEFSIDINPQQPEGEKKKPILSTSPSQNTDSPKEEKPQEDKPKDDSAVVDSAQNADTVVAPIAQADTLQNSESKADISSQPIEPINEGDGLWSIFIIAFLAGLAAIFTPCVFPMIPMTVSYFLKKENKFDAIIYGVSIIALYTVPVALLIIISNVAGGGEFTAGIFNALSTHWLPNILFFIVFMIFALSFFGMFEITMPSGIINRAENRGNKGGLFGAFFLAFVLVLVSFSCTGPIVGSVLVESASGGNAVKPIVAMFGFSLAFAMPFTLFAFFPGWMKNLPKSGGWLNTVKVVLGFVEFALGFKFLSVADQTYHWHILDREVYLAIWIATSILLGLYLLGKIKLPNDSDIPFVKVPRLILALIAFAFAIYMLPGMWGAPLKALSGYIPPLTTQDFVMGQGNVNQAFAQSTLCDKPLYGEHLKLPHGIDAYFEYNQAVECAKKQNKPLLIVFTGHGCVNCRKMEEYVWSDNQVLATMKDKFVIAALYTDDRTEDISGNSTIGKVNTELQISKYQINAQPYYVMLDASQPEKPLIAPQGYNPDPQSFVQYLQNGLNAYLNNAK
ncbi:MAG: thioredoxin family protein [Bacteroidales bacterium]|nr:thioredoxin family protein [Bacteroidales bacterium]